MNTLRNKWRLRLALALNIVFLGCASVEPVPTTEATAAMHSAAPARQILVMLHLPPPHFQPGAAYGGGYGNDAGESARRRIAAALADEYQLRLGPAWPMPLIGVDCFVMETAPGQSPEQVARQLSRDPRVAWAQPSRLFHSLFRAMNGSDPLYPAQPAARLWHLADMHAVATGRRVRIAVIDSGIEAEHPDLAGQVAEEVNFVDGSAYAAERHGTAVAGIIAARSGNGIGIAGIAPDARLLALRACWEASPAQTECSSFTLGKALHAAVLKDAQVINLSLTGPADPLVDRLLDAALARRIKVVAAADPQRADGGYPASHPGVFAVADSVADSAPEPSAKHETPMLAAPGHDIPTTLPGGRWDFVSGSSFAAAHISGLVALLSELQPALPPAQLRQAIVILPSHAGLVDACTTFMHVTGTCSCSCRESHAAATAYP